MMKQGAEAVVMHRGIYVSLVFLCALFLLASCGFRPVHSAAYQAERGAVSGRLAEVMVNASTSRSDQLLKAETEDRLNPDNVAVEKRFVLDVAVAEVNIPLFVSSDGTYGRGNLQFTLSYTLRSSVDNSVVASSTMTRVSSYAASETNAIYASYVAQEDARKRGIIELSKDIVTRLANILDKDPAAGAP
jgi:hypothetical protein